MHIDKSTRPDGANGLRGVTTVRSREILNYFGKCRACGYPARAVLRTVCHGDGVVTDSVIASCELPCGWSGPVEPSVMTMPTRWP
ncbi:hypothetical protein NONO_c18900 [Nocardia nova SH22a]|uniref:Uncharacterized protein n=1 Tax=Nocardia nova SH22a TaxID=1415166 RepID=W5TBE5_9NOCA|nr:hypothetical protein [Nocardia nova]AHH16690.1 hypothetical protein NONO_c18900 [Nocardia nova SH22a]